MRVYIFLITLLLSFASATAQQALASQNINKVDVKAANLVERFCDYIVDIGTSSHINGLSLEEKRAKVSDTGKLFFNYREDPRMMTTTRSNGSKSRKPVYQYMNNLLSQAEDYSRFKKRQYQIKLDSYYRNGEIDDKWIFERTLSDGCELYYKEFRVIQTYRIVDIFNEDIELRNRVGREEIDAKIIKVYVIVKPNSNALVRLGDVSAEPIDDRK